MQNNIVLITDNERVAQKINKKVLLLRNEDKLQTIKHADCFDVVRKIKPVLVLYHPIVFDFTGFISILLFFVGFKIHAKGKA